MSSPGSDICSARRDADGLLRADLLELNLGCSPFTHDIAGDSDKNAVWKITENMVAPGSHVVFDWDNTLKLYDTVTRRLSLRVSYDLLYHLKHDLGCHLYIISALRPSALNLATLLHEVHALGLTDIFCNLPGQGAVGDVLVCGDYARRGNVIICGYNKAETFLKLSSFSAARGDRVFFFDDESVNVSNFRTLVHGSVCYLCK